MGRGVRGGLGPVASATAGHARRWTPAQLGPDEATAGPRARCTVSSGFKALTIRALQPHANAQL